jgi:hypothetical protein
MKRPYFKPCNHGCKARKPVGQATNGACHFPGNLYMLREQAGLIWGYHHDDEVRKFAEKVVALLEHIVEIEEDAA